MRDEVRAQRSKKKVREVYLSSVTAAHEKTFDSVPEFFFGSMEHLSNDLVSLVIQGVFHDVDLLLALYAANVRAVCRSWSEIVRHELVAIKNRVATQLLMEQTPEYRLQRLFIRHISEKVHTMQLPSEEVERMETYDRCGMPSLFCKTDDNANSLMSAVIDFAARHSQDTAPFVIFTNECRKAVWMAKIDQAGARHDSMHVVTKLGSLPKDIGFLVWDYGTTLVQYHVVHRIMSRTLLAPGRAIFFWTVDQMQKGHYTLFYEILSRANNGGMAYLFRERLKLPPRPLPCHQSNYMKQLMNDMVKQEVVYAYPYLASVF